MKLTKHTLIWIVIGWVFLTLFNYYFMNFFFLAFELLGLILILLIISIVQLVKLIKERKELSKLRVQKFIVFFALLVLTLYRDSVNKVIEKVDWQIFYTKRTEIVERVKMGEINSDTDRPYWRYELPYRFPVISNGGNEIMIDRDDNLNTTTIKFWIFRNFFDSPSTLFIYTNDSTMIEKINKKINSLPSENWKIEDNWYRTYGAY